MPYSVMTMLHKSLYLDVGCSFLIASSLQLWCETKARSRKMCSIHFPLKITYAHKCRFPSSVGHVDSLCNSTRYHVITCVRTESAIERGSVPLAPVVFQRGKVYMFRTAISKGELWCVPLGVTVCTISKFYGSLWWVVVKFKHLFLLYYDAVEVSFFFSFCL